MALSRVETDGITDSAITAVKIADGTVVAAEIASNAVTTIKINADAVDGTKIADNAINSEHYTDASIDLAHLAADSVDGTKIADNAINSEHYTDGSIDLAHMSVNSIDSDQYVDASIDNAHLADDAVGVAELSATGTPTSSTFLRGDNSWQTAGSTSASDLTSGTLPIARIANDAIDSIHYAAGSIDEEHIAADAVNFATHLKAGTDGELITWDAAGNPAAVLVGTSGHVLTSGGTGVAPTFVAAAGGGKILQIQSSFNGTGAQTTTRNVWYEIGTAVTLTPASTSSTILLFSKGNAFLQGGSGYSLVYYSIQRTLSGSSTDDISTKSAIDFDARSTGTLFGQFETTIVTLGKDSPSTTSALTYQAQYYTNSISWGGAGGVYNIDLIAMEVAA